MSSVVADSLAQCVAQFRNHIIQRYNHMNELIATIEVSKKNNEGLAPSILSLSEVWYEACESEEEKKGVEEELKGIKELYDSTSLQIEDAEYVIQKYRECTHEMEDILLEFTDAAGSVKSIDEMSNAIILFVDKIKKFEV